MKRLHYGWVMVLIAVAILTTNALIFYSFGIFLRPITMEFGWDRGAFSAAMAISMLGAAALAIITGRLSDISLISVNPVHLRSHLFNDLSSLT